ncbi:hypothetical protein [Sanguibacter massiliensis]|uniref:hypothetical protein n=1 Tax=Sanguibacter massiliensis TaxID=1973217 RepID=UPI00101ADE97|nr:hypothetical protein [Sanguibacter massiliensis]
MADRPMLRDHWHARDYPDRLVVVRDGAQHRPWWVYLGAARLGEYATHAEAITAADKLARTETT